MGWNVEISECDEGHPGVVILNDDEEEVLFLHSDEARQVGAWLLQAAQSSELRSALEAALADSVPPDLKSRILDLTTQHWETLHDPEEEE